jgi:hypothetical protein
MIESNSEGQSLFAADDWELLSPLFVAETSLLYGAIAALASKAAIATVTIATVGSVLLLFMIRKKFLHSHLIRLSQFNLIYLIVLLSSRFIFQSSLQYYS